jgi:hypothetical protein
MTSRNPRSALVHRNIWVRSAVIFALCLVAVPGWGYLVHDLPLSAQAERIRFSTASVGLLAVWLVGAQLLAARGGRRRTLFLGVTWFGTWMVGMIVPWLAYGGKEPNWPVVLAIGAVLGVAGAMLGWSYDVSDDAAGSTAGH